MASPGRSARNTVWWDEQGKEWVGYDVPDFHLTKRPDYMPPPDAKGAGSTVRVRNRFTIAPDGRGWLYAPARDEGTGPLPTPFTSL